MPAASAAPVTTGNQQPSLACTRQKECCPGCARYGQRGPDEETEMNFMPVGQCPAIKATRTARWCQRRKVCFQVPMHFAADALSACLCGSPLQVCLLQLKKVELCPVLVGQASRESCRQKLPQKFENIIFRSLVTIFWLTCTHVGHNAPRQGIASATSRTSVIGDSVLHGGRVSKKMGLSCKSPILG